MLYDNTDFDCVADVVVLFGLKGMGGGSSVMDVFLYSVYCYETCPSNRVFLFTCVCPEVDLIRPYLPDDFLPFKNGL
jgi:hypothetical protein